jgi:hypothetical protein
METLRRPKANPLLVSPWMILDGDYLVSAEVAPKWAEARPTLLDDFLEIRSDQDILTFARKWGTLGICQEHRVPGCRESSLSGRPCWPEQLSEHGYDIRTSVWREPTSVWHSVVAKGNIMRRLGDRILSGGAGTKSDWEGVVGPLELASQFATSVHTAKSNPAYTKMLEKSGCGHPGQPWNSVKQAKGMFSIVMQSWLDQGDVRPFFVWERDRWAIRSSVPVGVFPLFGTLALYLAVAVAGGIESAICSFCGREYFPQRRPTSGKCNCCGDEPCKRAYWRESKRLKVKTVRGT